MKKTNIDLSAIAASIAVIGKPKEGAEYGAFNNGKYAPNTLGKFNLHQFISDMNDALAKRQNYADFVTGGQNSFSKDTRAMRVAIESHINETIAGMKVFARLCNKPISVWAKSLTENIAICENEKALSPTNNVNFVMQKSIEKFAILFSIVGAYELHTLDTLKPRKNGFIWEDIQPLYETLTNGGNSSSVKAGYFMHCALNHEIAFSHEEKMQLRDKGANCHATSTARTQTSQATQYLRQLGIVQNEKGKRNQVNAINPESFNILKVIIEYGHYGV
jgi:hypothetical protein